MTPGEKEDQLWRGGERWRPRGREAETDRQTVGRGVEGWKAVMFSSGI